MGEQFWRWFIKNIDGKWLTEDRMIALIFVLKDLDEGITFDIGNGYTMVDENGELISKQEMIFVAHSPSSLDVVHELKMTAPSLQSWDIVARYEQ